MISKIENKFDKLSNKLDFKGIFKPTLTSKLLINSSYNLLKKKTKSFRFRLWWWNYYSMFV